MKLNFHFKCLKRHGYTVKSMWIWSWQWGIWSQLAMVQILELLPTSSATWTNYFTYATLSDHIHKMEVVIIPTSESCCKWNNVYEMLLQYRVWLNKCSFLFLFFFNIIIIWIHRSHYHLLSDHWQVTYSLMSPFS